MTTDPRAALDRFVAALETHLQATSNRRGEADPAVAAAYQILADAFDKYDNALYEAYDEVTPFVLYEDTDNDDGDSDEESDDIDDFDPDLDDDDDEDDIDDDLYDDLEESDSFDDLDEDDEDLEEGDLTTGPRTKKRSAGAS